MRSSSERADPPPGHDGVPEDAAAPLRAYECALRLATSSGCAVRAIAPR